MLFERARINTKCRQTVPVINRSITKAKFSYTQSESFLEKVTVIYTLTPVESN